MKILILILSSITFISFSQKNDTLILKMIKSYNEKKELIYQSSYEYDFKNNLIKKNANDLTNNTSSICIIKYDSFNQKEYELIYRIDSIRKLLTDSISYSAFEIKNYHFDYKRNEIKITTSKLDSNKLSFYENTKTIDTFWKNYKNEKKSENSEEPILNQIKSEFADSIFRDNNGNEILRKTYDVLGMIYPYSVNGVFVPKQNSPNTLISISYSKWNNNNKLIEFKRVNNSSEIEFEEIYFFDESNNLAKQTTKYYLQSGINEYSNNFSYSVKNNLITEKSWSDNSDSYQILIYKTNNFNSIIEQGSFLNDGTPLSKTINKYKNDLLIETKSYYYNNNKYICSDKTLYFYDKVKIKL